MKKPLLISILVLVLVWIVEGMYISYKVINDEIFDSISPPTALFNKDIVGFFFRLIEPVSGDSVSIAMFIVPSIIFVCLLIYFIKKRKEIGVKKAVVYLLSSIVTIIIATFIFALTIPGLIEWGVLRVKAAIDVQRSLKILSSKEMITDRKEILSYIKSNKAVKVYSDYGNAGSILAVLLGDKEKLSFYESFYLPIHLSQMKDIKVTTDNSNMLLFDHNLIITKVNDGKELEEILLPIANNLLVNSYGKYITLSRSSLKTFLVTDGEKYQSLYIQKRVSDLEKNITYNKQAYVANKKIINEYQNNMAAEDEQYRKYVIEDGIKYENGCLKYKKYNDCTEFKATIEENTRIIAKNRVSIENEYKDAIRNNVEIKETLAYQEKLLSNILDGSDSLERNKSEYSAGVAMGNDSIYLRFSKDNPISSEILRLTTHELLHIYTNDDNRTLPEAINEGITDYLAIQSLGLSDIDAIRASGYPIEIQVVLALLEKIKKEDLIKVYFGGREEDFKKLMKDSFPKLNYPEFVSRMKSIFDKTYHVNGVNRSFDAALIDHEEVREIRRKLELPEQKFQFMIY